MSWIVFDLEWNDGGYRSGFNELLEIGAVKAAFPGGPVSDHFRAYIKPKFHKKLGRVAKLLPAAKLVKEQGEDMDRAVERFLAWCGPGAAFATWGPDDLPVLRQNLTRLGRKYPLPSTYCDVQRDFGRLTAAAKQVALQDAVDYCRVPDALEYHDALYDAFYTAAVAEVLYRAGGAGAFHTVTVGRESEARLSDLAPLESAVLTAAESEGGFSGEADFLNSAFARRQSCPVCGEPFHVAVWCPLTTGPGYMARFVCPEDGRRYLWATAVERDGGWTGRVHLLPDSDTVRLHFAHRDKERPHLCKSLGGGRRRRSAARKRRRHGGGERQAG